jgi:DNA invertase Pin-like site-specific DNA recombinase
MQSSYPTFTEQFYKAITYYRLSKEDSNKSNFSVSDSIENQRKLVEDYVRKEGNIEIVDEAIDDGYTGTNFDRPGFQYVLECLKSGKADTVIVKDLSRLGREYIETGRYIEMMFPQMNVRFIAINDSVDTNNHKSSDDLLIPMKNLLNENYCRELSLKLRKQFKIQRENGEFINNFAPYGYMRDPQDKHHLLVDESTSQVVKGIYELFVSGYSPARIATYLNEHDIMSPYDYKQSTSQYKSGFKGPGESIWNHTTIRRILTNSVYTGELCQGKTTTPSFKVKKVQVLDRGEWAVVEDAHEAIISGGLFEVAQKLLQRDIRVSTTDNKVQPLGGFIFCGDCGKAMCRRRVKRGNKYFYYYMCGGYKRKQGCSVHNISQRMVENAVLNAVTSQLELLVEVSELVKRIGENDIVNKKVKYLDLQITAKEQEMEKNQNAAMRLYDSYTEELITREEYLFMKEKYIVRIKTQEKTIRELEEKKKQLVENGKEATSWIGHYMKFQGIEHLTHEAVATMIERVEVYEDKRIEIIFSFENQLAELKQYLNEIGEENVKWQEEAEQIKATS